MTIVELRDYLRYLLQDPNKDTWDDPIIESAAVEAVITVARHFPHENAQQIDLSFDISDRCFTLPPEASRLLQVQLFTNQDGKCTSLLPYTWEQATEADPCWLCEDEASAGHSTHYVYSRENPRRVYVNGQVNDQCKLTVMASFLPDALNTDVNDTTFDIGFITPITDLALRRLRGFEDTAAPAQQLYQNLAERTMDSIGNIDANVNPETIRQVHSRR